MLITLPAENGYSDCNIRSIQPSPSRSEASARKIRGCSTRLGLRCDVTAKGASERLADFGIFSMAENLYIQITL
jgi:hypothetical protein